MRIDYDLDADAVYITLLDEQVAQTVEIEDLTMVDLTEDGRLIGIEVIGLSRAWALEEVLNRYEVSAFDAQQLRSQFFTVGVRGQQEVPKIDIECVPVVC